MHLYGGYLILKFEKMVTLGRNHLSSGVIYSERETKKLDGSLHNYSYE